jgi:2'-5' RNA ligase
MTREPASAVVVRARLPRGLERLRQRSVADAPDGIPAHLTLLYPFVEPSRLDASVRAAVAAVAARHVPFDYRLVAEARWPETIYVAVEPTRPFVALQADLGAAFPEHPIYGKPPGFAFVPHVTIAEGGAIEGPSVLEDPAWATLPRAARAAALDVIADRGDGWRLVWRIRLGGRTARDAR